MKHLISIFIIGFVLAFSACTDPDLDPLRTDQIKKSALITLRGTAVNNLDDADNYLGAVDKFSKVGDLTKETFDFDADFIAEDITSLSKVEVFAKATEKSARVRIATVDGAAFVIAKGGKYPTGKFSIPLAAIIDATKVDISKVENDSYLYIECDITLKNGDVIAAGDVTNSSLFETAFFYPAHKLLYLVTK
jgi:hypothetical protein